MTTVVGREASGGEATGSEAGTDERATAALGTFRAPDGSAAASFELDVDGPHAAAVVGKRGTGKSYTLGVLAEELARTEGIAPVVVDPMGVFGTLAESSEPPVPARVRTAPTVPADALAPRTWCSLLDLDPASPVGSLVWRAASERATVDGMSEWTRSTDAEDGVRRAATNHLRTAAAWDVFDPDGLAPDALFDECVTVLDCSALGRAPANALCHAVAAALYDGRVDDPTRPLPWLLVDEAHVFFEGVAAPALRRLLTRGRHPGTSLVVATQRPAALPPVVVSQSDLLVAHRLTGRADREALSAARGSYVHGDVLDVPRRPGAATLIDDTTETVLDIRIRERDTPHGGDSPSVREDGLGG